MTEYKDQLPADEVSDKNYTGKLMSRWYSLKFVLLKIFAVHSCFYESLINDYRKNTGGGGGGGGVGTPSIIWGTTTRILIIFGVPPHKYKYLK